MYSASINSTKAINERNNHSVQESSEHMEASAVLTLLNMKAFEWKKSNLVESSASVTSIENILSTPTNRRR